MSTAINIHGTAIIVGTTGLLFVGPSGSGKSALAFACLASARMRGLFAALVSDDQVFVSQQGSHLLAERARTIAGLIELRGSGLVATDSHPAALLHYAILPVDLARAPRLPPEDERFELFEGALLPLVRLASQAPDPFAMLDAIIDFSADSDRDDGLKTVF